MEPVTFGLHTGSFKHQISRREANSLKAYFGIDPSSPLPEQTQFFQDGINALWLEEVNGPRTRFYIHARINFARAIGIGNYIIMPYTMPNIRAVIRAINKVLKVMPVAPQNANFADWTVERFDSAFDIHEINTRKLMKLLSRTLDLSDRRKRCSRVKINDTESHALRFKCNSFIYNIYVKLFEVIGKGKALTDEELEMIRYLLRVERQNLEDAVKKLLPQKTVGDLENPTVCDNVLRTMIDESKIFFGFGDYYSITGIINHFPVNSPDVRAMIEAIRKISANSLEAEYSTYQGVKAILERYNVAPVGIPWNDVDCIQGLYNRIMAAYSRPRERRQHNPFPVPCVGADGRYRANISLYWADAGTQRVSVAGRDLAIYESKVFDKLKSVYLANYGYVNSQDGRKFAAYKKSVDSVLCFRKTIKTTTVKKEVDMFIETFSSLGTGKDSSEQEE